MNSINQNYKLLFLIAIFAFIFSSCKKEEGYGGKATIKGIVIERIYDNSFSTLLSQRVASEEDVYIEFGSNGTVGDDTKTSSSGKFEFNYLLPGKYYIYIYSEDSITKNNNKINPIIKEVNISEDDEVVDIGTIIKYKSVDIDGEGFATIKGTVVERIYDREFTTLQIEKYAVDKDVYIELGNSGIIGDDTKTSSTGKFEFKYLLPGKYYVYIYSEDSVNHNTDNNHPVVQEINITSDGGTYDLGKIVKYKTIDYDEGFAKVKGVIGGIYFSKNFTYIVGLDYAKDHDVFLYYDNNPTSENKVSTIYNGSYSYTNLIKGKYTLYTYSDNNDNSGIPLVIKKNFEISSLNQVVQMDSITINIEN
jgi:hypothetical protein